MIEVRAARLVALAALLLLARCSTAEVPRPLPSAFAEDPLWDDGQAEVATYAAERVIYGAPRPYVATLITVKEEFDAETLVKADGGDAERRTFPVLKLNAARTIPTPNYEYRYLTSAFVRRDDPFRAVKTSVGSQEWCGNTFKLLKAGDPDEAVTLHWHSYFDGEADGALELPRGDALLLVEDALPLSLRALRFEPGLRHEVRLTELLTTNHAPDGEVRDAVLTVAAREEVEALGAALPAWRVELQHADGVDRYWFEEAAPHVLLRMECHDGRKMRIEARERRVYW